MKERNIAKDLTIGTGGRLISDVIDNSHRDHVKRVKTCFYIEDTIVFYGKFKFRQFDSISHQDFSFK